VVTFAEEIMLLALDDERGEFRELPSSGLAFALAGALLMDLALRQRLDSDLRALTVVSDQPTGEPLLDPILAEVATGDVRSTRHWLRLLAGREQTIRTQVLDRLVERGILRRDAQRVFWAFSQRRYPTVDGSERREVRTRLRHLLLSEELPDPRDAALVGLVETCRLFDGVLSDDEVAASRTRIMTVARLDLIGQQVLRAVREIEREIGLALRT
jgi:golgi phosphoprotein 3